MRHYRGGQIGRGHRCAAAVLLTFLPVVPYLLRMAYNRRLSHLASSAGRKPKVLAARMRMIKLAGNVPSTAADSYLVVPLSRNKTCLSHEIEVFGDFLWKSFPQFFMGQFSGSQCESREGFLYFYSVLSILFRTPCGLSM